MSKTNKSYSQIIRSTSIFGGAQLANILIGIIRNKLVAVLLGTIGVGLISMYQSAIDVVKSISSLGIETTGVREIASVSENMQQLNQAVSIIHKWTFILASFGSSICLLFCYPISHWAFESNEYVIQIGLLSICVFFSTLAAGEAVILQGMRKISYMVKSGLIWNFLGLLIAIPLYYFFRNNAIVPVFILISIAMYLSARHYRKRIDVEISAVSYKIAINKGVAVLRIGSFIVLAAIQNQLSYFIVRSMISNYINIDAVGLFQAAWTITNVYFMIVLRSMGADFYPRLSAIVNSSPKTRRLVNEQTYIVLIVSTPLIISLLLFSKLILSILYTSQFIGAETLLNWQVLGTFLKILSWPLGFILLAKGKGLLFFVSEVIFSVFYLVSIYCLFPSFGISSAGIGYLIAYFVYLFTVYMLGRKLCNFRWIKENWIIIVSSLIPIVFIFYITEYQNYYRFVIGVPLLILSVVYSLYKLHKVMPLNRILSVFKDK